MKAKEKQYLGAFMRWFAIGGLVFHSAPYFLKYEFIRYFNLPLPTLNPNPDIAHSMLDILNILAMMSYPALYLWGAKIEGNAIIKRISEKSKELSDKVK